MGASASVNVSGGVGRGVAGIATAQVPWPPGLWPVLLPSSRGQPSRAAKRTQQWLQPPRVAAVTVPVPAAAAELTCHEGRWHT